MATNPDIQLENRVRLLPEQLRRARERVRHLECECERYGFTDLVRDGMAELLEQNEQALQMAALIREADYQAAIKPCHDEPDRVYEIPDPALYINVLPLPVRMALKASSRKASRENAELLRPWGLCEYGGECLTNYGITVRGLLKE